MKDLTTRKIILGLMIAFVLAFGVQGTADAIDTLGITSPNPADLGYLGSGNDITLTVSISTSSDTNADGNDNTIHYDQEAVTIGVRGAGAKITTVGSTTGLSATSYTLRESPGTTLTTLPSTAAVTISTSSHGEVTVTISDATPAGDIESGNSRAGSAVLTVYVVRPIWQVPRTTRIALRNLTNGVGQGYYANNDQLINTVSEDYQVTYNVYDSDGTTAATDGGVYVKKGNRPSSPSGSATLTTSSRAQVYLAIGNGSKVVEVNVVGTDGDAKSKGLYIFQNPTLVTTATTNTNQTGNPGAVIGTPFTVTVVEGDGSTGVPGVPVKFDVKNKSKTTGGTLIFDEADTTLTGALIDNRNMDSTATRQAGSTIYVRTGTGGEAEINYQLGSASGEQLVDVTAVGFTKTIKASTTISETTRELSIHANQSRQGSPNIFDLIALVKNGGNPEQYVQVTFTTTRGILTNTPTGKTNIDSNGDGTPDSPALNDNTEESGKDVDDLTDELGRAQVIYNTGDSSGGAEVIASISVIQNNRVIDLQEIVFNIRGGTGNQQQQQQQQQQTARLTITASGEGTERTVTVNAFTATNAPVPGLAVALSGTVLTASRQVITGTPTTITLPTTPNTYTLSATAVVGGYEPASTTFEVTAPGTLSLEEVGARAANGGQLIRITVRDSSNALVSGDVVVTLGGVVSRTATITDGTGSIPITVPTTGGPHRITLSAPDYTTQSFTLSTTGQQVGDDSQQPTTTRGSAGVADSVQASGQVFRTGTANTQLDLPLSVRVLDGNDTGVANVRVTFRVRTGQGRLSQRGNGRATAVETDRSGYARAPYTPLGKGTSTVRANAAGVTQTVTFTITANGASETGTDPGTSEPAETPSREISPEVRIGAASRPPMVWVDGGGIYALVGDSVERFAPSVDNALNIAVGGSKVYWTEKTGESSGTINSANLDGSGVKELASILAVPMGIAVGEGGGKLYWTNSRGRIQSANLDGSKITNVLQNLPSPMDITIARGNLYWTQYDATAGAGSVGITNPAGRGSPKYISTGTDMPGSLVTSGTKVYWTEMTGTHLGTINSANLNGNGATQLASILAAPMGIGVDGLRSKLYWSNSRGRIQSANLDGSKIQNAVTGLGMPGDMVLSSSLKAPAAATPTKKDPTPTASNKYDVNRDGTVDSKDSDALIVAVAAGVTDAKYDVNGDGKVDINDVVAVTANRSGGAAGAPTLLGMKLNALEVDRLQEQIDLLIATNDRSPAAMRTLVYLQQLIVMARPSQTQLLANYPNPFNPETWIPYELATDTDVRITIYNAQGVVIRTLQLGQQSAGYYTDRERAAYWDGRNAFGEQVASGVYFYQLETDTMSALRKMVILK